MADRLISENPFILNAPDGVEVVGGVPTATFIGDAPDAGGPYGRSSGGWVPVEGGPYPTYRTADDLPAPDGGGNRVLEPGPHYIYQITLPPNERVVVGPGVTLFSASVGVGGISGSDATGAIVVTGGFLVTISVANSSGPAILLQGFGGFISGVLVTDGGVRNSSMDPSGFITVSDTSVLSASDDVSFDIGGSFASLVFLTAFASNTVPPVDNWIGFRFRADTVVPIMDWSGGGVDGRGGTGAIGIERDPAAVLSVPSIRGATFRGFGGSGAMATSGIDIDQASSFYSGNQGTGSPESSPRGAIELVSAVSLPETTIATPGVYQQIVLADGNNSPSLSAEAHLITLTLPDQLVYGWDNGKVVNVTLIASLQKSGGNVEAKVRIVRKRGAGAWVQQGVPGVADIAGASTQISSGAAVDMLAGDLIRAEVTAASAVDLEVKSFQLLID